MSTENKLSVVEVIPVEDDHEMACKCPRHLITHWVEAGCTSDHPALRLPAAARCPAPCQDEADFPFLPAEGMVSNDTLRHCIRLNVYRERERCAKLAETWEGWCGRTGYSAEEYAAEDIAEKIRSGE